MMEPVRGSRLVCGEGIILEYPEPRLWQFWDYSWVCPICGRTHCSQCSYPTDGETITVRDCGRFGEAPDGR